MFESFFLGPHAENADFFERIWGELLQRTLQHRRETFSRDGDLNIQPPNSDEFRTVEQEIENFFAILHKEVPTFSNRYLGHMISDVSIPALIGNIAVLFCNPNLASKEVGEAGLLFELQAICELAKMIGFDVESARGHFTSGGTVANFEAFWRARYRLDHWLAMSAYLLEKGHTGESIFTLAHQGWDKFNDNREKFAIAIHELRDRSYVSQGPWDIARYYRESLKIDFPQPVILVPGNKHYSWPKSANVFGISEKAIWPTDLDRFGRVSVSSLKKNIEKARKLQQPIMMNVSVAGTTELGSVDPVDEVNALLDQYRQQEGIHIWHHVDAAYGGYFCSTFKGGESELSDRAIRAFTALSQVDSVTLDPHKLGFVPYSCGAILVPDPMGYSVSHISAPYLAEDESADYPSWSTTLEGSRPATGAGAVWLSSRVLPLDATGHGALLNETLRASNQLAARLEKNFADIYFMPGSDTNIVSFVLAPKGSGLQQVNRLNAAIIDGLVKSPNFAISRTALNLKSYAALIKSVVKQWDGAVDDEYMMVIRMVVMSPYLDQPETTGRIVQEFIDELRALESSHRSDE